MDSGNSGSMHSSSTGGGDNDQEYESRSDSLSPFFNPFGAFENAQSLQFPSLNKFNNGSSFSFPLIFDQQTPNSFAALDTNPNNFIPINTNNWPNKSHPMIRSQPEEAQLQQPRPAGPGNGSGRNPKKRCRASRRAPTTVLTTDTSNFRQMVQEFTGIPAPPFSSSSAFPTTRLDLFGFRSGMGTGTGSCSRPVHQKMHLNHDSTSGGNFLSFQSLLQRPSSSSLNNLGSGHVISANNVGGNYSDATNGNSLENNNNNGSINLRPEACMLDNSWICSSDLK